MRLIPAVAFALLISTAAHAQREAVSADLSPELAGQVFARAVAEICVPAVAGKGVSALSAAQQGTLRPTQDAETRKQAGAGADETVWDVMDGKGVVTVREKAGRCVVSVYGPPLRPTVASLSGALGSAYAATNGLGGTMKLVREGKTLMVQVAGSEPGAPGHQSRFSVVTATVQRAQ